MSGEDRNDNGSGFGAWGRSEQDRGTGAPESFSDPGAQQRHWEALSSQYPGADPNSSDYPGYPGYRSSRGQNQEDTREQPGVQGPVAGPAPAATAPTRRFSTPAVATLVVAVGVAASAVTAVVMQNNDNGGNVTTSFSQSGSGERQNTAAADPDPGTVEEVAQNVLPSVVSIQTVTQQGGAEGSGSIISSDGMILTNNHVVAEAEGGGAQLTVTTNDGRQLDADVVATDPQTDLAVVKAEGADDLQPIAFGDSEGLQVGESVVAVGSPLGLSSTVTSGIVSAKNRPVQAGGEDGGEASLIDAIQTDAAINPGNSGGALVNLQGELVGIPSVIATLGAGAGGESGSIGLGFAIPVNQAESTARQLIDNGSATHPVIGATVNTAPDSDAAGAEVVEVTDGGPAEEAGLRDGDIVTRVDDRIVDNGVSLIAAIRSYSIGDEVTLTVTDGNGGDERELTVTLSESDS